MISIYVLCCPKSGDVRYVGQTRKLRVRLYQHINDKKMSHKTSWIQSLKAVGLKPTIHEIESFADHETDEWQTAERFWIAYLRFLGCRLTNLAIGGEGGCNTPEIIAKISASNRGKKRSPEFCERMRQASTGKKQSPELIAKRTSWRIGVPRTAETRAKMSNAKKGMPAPEHLKIARQKAAEFWRGRKQNPIHVAKRKASFAATVARKKQKQQFEIA